jgi:GntR family transcriptional repressor for pyruvate dehydrogenase complex
MPKPQKSRSRKPLRSETAAEADQSESLPKSAPAVGWAKPGGMSRGIYEEIFRRITDGTYLTNNRLPTEQDFAKEFEVSRPVVREALARLRIDGLVDSRKGAGSFVRRRPDELALQLAPVASIADIQRCLEFRYSLEGEAAYYAAQRRDTNDLRKIRDAAKRLEDIPSTGQLGVVEDFNFHLVVAEASKNNLYPSTLLLIRNQVTYGMNLTRSISRIRPENRLVPVLREHLAIWEAIRDQDADRARDAMRQHISNGQKRLFEGNSN